ncbi:hypothetical protein M011DRAFT_466478 [Sporormia fimetaria CBS 119925]|uniref:Uncharacterized protein n=1 Tax=Sporormia fimetaria CBS 119925 TaxID=1340428 RepID=A0A6A6VDQ7_9PLEO|nr:hypothetical protein M011DRAFT_466478 [Sporormia fimetaria CBS 119925]
MLASTASQQQIFAPAFVPAFAPAIASAFASAFSCPCAKAEAEVHYNACSIYEAAARRCQSLP